MTDGDRFAPPPFDAAESLVTLKRQLRQLRGLTERRDGFELRGLPVLQLQAGTGAIAARLARRPAQTPEWIASTLKDAADVRRWVDTVKQNVERWSRED